MGSPSSGAATAARTHAELGAEIAILADLEGLARTMRHSGTDRKRTELRDLLHTNEVITSVGGDPRKIIVFTEHRNTLRCLVEKTAR
jgi:ERCC4-related helicase